MHLSDAEWTVMNAVWDQGVASGRDVWTAVASRRDWSYSTVKTMLARLVEKGALSERKDGRRSVFAPAVDREEARRSALEGLVERVFGGALSPLLQHVVADRRLSARDRARLEALAAELKEEES